MTHTLRRVVIVVGLTTVLAAGFALGVLYAADSRLDLADANLEKGRALLVASESGPVPDKVADRFYKHVERAIKHIDEAREEILDAKMVVDTYYVP